MSIPIEYYEKLAELIEFRNGKPYWKEKPAYIVDMNKPAGNIHDSGYRRINLRINQIKKGILAHRLHYFMVHRELPEFIDHINQVKDDNRLENLRAATRSQNNRNRKPRGESEYIGVSWHKTSKKWTARCTIGYKVHYLGLFDSEIGAAKAYDKFCIENNLTFANLNFKQENIKES